MTALSSSTHHIWSLIQTEPLRMPVMPGQIAARLPVRSSYMHSPTAKVFDVPSVMSPKRILLFCHITPPKSWLG